MNNIVFSLCLRDEKVKPCAPRTSVPPQNVGLPLVGCLDLTAFSEIAETKPAGDKPPPYICIHPRLSVAPAKCRAAPCGLPYNRWIQS